MTTAPNDEDVFAESGETPPRERRSSFTLLRNVVIDLTQVVEDSTELIGASVREELAEFREDMARQALSIVAIIIGGLLLAAGLAMLVSAWLGSWSATLLIFGAIFVLIAVLLQSANRRDAEDTRE